MVIECPKCHEKTELMLTEAVDELGEVFKCNHCGYLIMYVEK